MREGGLDLSAAHPRMGALRSWALSLAARCTPQRGDAGIAPDGAQSGWPLSTEKFVGMFTYTLFMVPLGKQQLICDLVGGAQASKLVLELGC